MNLKLLFYIRKIRLYFTRRKKAFASILHCNGVKDHAPSTIALRTDRMYAEAFYIRLLDPNVSLTDYDTQSTNIILSHEEDQLDREPRYTHVSPSYVRKPGRHLEYAIVDQSTESELPR